MLINRVSPFDRDAYGDAVDGYSPLTDIGILFPQKISCRIEQEL